MRSKSAGVPKTPTYTGSPTGVSARTVVSVVASASGWVLTQPITARSTSSATAYVVIRQPRRDGVTASEPAPGGLRRDRRHGRRLVGPTGPIRVPLR